MNLFFGEILRLSGEQYDWKNDADRHDKGV